MISLDQNLLMNQVLHHLRIIVSIYLRHHNRLVKILEKIKDFRY
jgi:hypothetical protein